MRFRRNTETIASRNQHRYFPEKFAPHFDAFTARQCRSPNWERAGFECTPHPQPPGPSRQLPGVSTLPSCCRNSLPQPPPCPQRSLTTTPSWQVGDNPHPPPSPHNLVRNKVKSLLSVLSNTTVSPLNHFYGFVKKNYGLASRVAPEHHSSPWLGQALRLTSSPPTFLTTNYAPTPSIPLHLTSHDTD
jgi:hypothetical protein